MNTSQRSTYVQEFDGLRGVLAGWVCITHILCWCGFAAVHLPKAAAHWWLYFLYAQPAVEVFIILSGFAISALLEKKGQNYRRFMRGRFYRIVPVYMVCLLLSLATLPFTTYILHHAHWNGGIYFTWVQALSTSELARPFAHLAAHLTLLHGALPRAVLPDSAGTILPPAWSISLEWQYYLVAPLLVVLFRSRTGLLLIGLAAILGAHFAAHWVNPQPAFLGAQLPLFILGIASYRLYRWVASTAKPAAIVPTLVLAVGVFAAVTRWRAVAVAIWAVCLWCTIPGAAHPHDRFSHGFRRFLLSRFMQAVGKASYSLYLVHWPVVIAMLYALLKIFPSATTRGALLFLVAVGLPVIALATYLVHRFIEVPFMRMGRGPTVRHESGAPAPIFPGTSRMLDAQPAGESALPVVAVAAHDLGAAGLNH